MSVPLPIDKLTSSAIELFFAITRIYPIFGNVKLLQLRTSLDDAFRNLKDVSYLNYINYKSDLRIAHEEDVFPLIDQVRSQIQQCHDRITLTALFETWLKDYYVYREWLKDCDIRRDTLHDMFWRRDLYQSKNTDNFLDEYEDDDDNDHYEDDDYADSGYIDFEEYAEA
ncbi:MAG: hypothetical protein EBT86_08520 [Actinobacteria bacterium]|nr:hypothetical protein [Actinomycetota bacterium]